jgi:hypothetical protein
LGAILLTGFLPLVVAVLFLAVVAMMI